MSRANEHETDEVTLRIIQAGEHRRSKERQTVLDNLTDRERSLVREAAVAGFVQATRYFNMPNALIPTDSQILDLMLDATLALPDLYPHLGTASQESLPEE